MTFLYFHTINGYHISEKKNKSNNTVLEMNEIKLNNKVENTHKKTKVISCGRGDYVIRHYIRK